MAINLTKAQKVKIKINLLFRLLQIGYKMEPNTICVHKEAKYKWVVSLNKNLQLL